MEPGGETVAPLLFFAAVLAFAGFLEDPVRVEAVRVEARPGSRRSPTAW